MHTDLGDIHVHTSTHTQVHTQAQAHTYTHILGDKKVSGIVVNYGMSNVGGANPCVCVCVCVHLLCGLVCVTMVCV